LTDPERFRLVFLSHFTKFWKQAFHIIQPDTLHALASESVSQIFAAKVAGQTKGCIRNDHFDPKDGE